MAEGKVDAVMVNIAYKFCAVFFSAVAVFVAITLITYAVAVWRDECGSFEMVAVISLLIGFSGMSGLAFWAMRGMAKGYGDFE